jgi:diacylglycerol O-acyltransferase
VDGAPAGSADLFPHRPPTAAELRADAFRSWLRTAKETPRAIRGLAASLRAARRVLPARAADCSLLSATGSQRRFAIVRGDLDAIHAAAHLSGAALSTLLTRRGEHVEEFVVSVPVSVRAATTTAAMGNRVNAMLVAVPQNGTARLSDIARRTRAARAAASTGVGSFAWLGTLFRIAVRAGLMRRFMNRQHLIHTVVSNIRGPQTVLRFVGHDITDIVPISVSEAGNVTVTFVAFSYAGRLIITVTADPEHLHDLDVLEAALRSELGLLERAAAGPVAH